MADTTELDVCPFCRNGHISIHPLDPTGGGGLWRTITMATAELRYAHCDGCGADGPPADTEAAAIAAWNRRHHG